LSFVQYLKRRVFNVTAVAKVQSATGVFLGGALHFIRKLGDS
jgi:hypothetical protein